MSSSSDSSEHAAQNAFPRIPDAILEGRSELHPPVDCPIHCLRWGKVIEKRRPWQKFCSQPCRRRHWAQTHDSDQRVKEPK